MRGRSVMRALAAAVLLPALASCGNSVVGGEVMPAYSPNEVAYGFGNRDATVVLHGDPFGDPAALAAATTAAMQGRVFGVVTNFTTTPGADARPDYRVVVVFNPAETLLASDLCARSKIPTAPVGADGTMIIQGAFCRGGALTSATGYVRQPIKPGTDGFDSLIGDLTSTLFPSRTVNSGVCRFPAC